MAPISKPYKAMPDPGSYNYGRFTISIGLGIDSRIMSQQKPTIFYKPNM